VKLKKKDLVLRKIQSEWRQALGDAVLVPEVIAENGNVGAIANRRPVDQYSTLHLVVV
jgi:cation transporter-like permease